MPSHQARTLTSSPHPEFAARLRAFSRRAAGRLRRLDLAWDLRQAIDATIDPSKIADIVLAHVATWVGGNAWALVEYDSSARLVVLSARGHKEAHAATVLAVAGWVVRHNQPLWAPDIRADRRVVGNGRLSAASVPLVSRGQVYGALVGIDRLSPDGQPRGVEKALADLAAMIASPAVSLENALQRAHAEALSVTDDLTQLYNSRFLNQVLRREAKRSIRSNRPLSMLFVDLDGFKGINDRHGHLAGSRALVEAAVIIGASRARPTSWRASAATNSPWCCPTRRPTARWPWPGGSANGSRRTISWPKRGSTSG